MGTFAESEKKVLSFMESVQEQKLMQEEEDAFQQSTDYKLKKLDENMDSAKDICLDTIFAKIYKDAVPLNDDYKAAYDEDLDKAFHDFMATRCPQGLEFYVKEGLKKGSPFAKRVLEAVDDLVKNEYEDKAMNIEDIDANQLVFRSSDDIQKKLDVVGQDLSAPEISQAVRDNVRQTVMSEITRAKKEKEDIKNLESELANDVNVNSEEKVQEAAELRGFNITRDYVPSLFSGIMINKMNKIQPLYESGQLQEVYTYNAMKDFTTEVTEEVKSESEEKVFAKPEELAFIEAVKEYTGLSVLKALKLESFDKYRINDLAQEYAQARF
jgi:hypothetical protein